ncbi:putative membrane protein YczE [Bacillus pakistanensis]|uniref:Membrane protein YczE n=1 Tax=Rossellomorea pakistanensis TaxID=992288 RepID=A0ABS2NBC4_9BACI|nr:YitT family protein [Bacillus pakistanensis]MBM7585155.1 putative membrane protein YczE [Bacillus pakistanensis]
MIREKSLRWTFFFVGLIVLALGITLTIKGKDLGIGPWDVFHYGLFAQFGLTIGTWSIIVGILLITMTAIFTKVLPKIGAFLNMLLIGVFIDFFNYIIPDPETILVQTVLFIIGTVIVGYGIGLYVSADLGAGPRDSLMLLIVEKTGWKIQWVRNGIEVIVFLLGWLLGGPVGIGTIFIAFFLGSMVGISLPQCQKLLQSFLIKGQDKEAEIA